MLFRIIVGIWSLVFLWIFGLSVVHSKDAYFVSNTPTSFAIFTAIILINLALIVPYRMNINRKQFSADIKHFGASFLEVMVTAFILSAVFIDYSSWYAKIAFMLTGFVGVLLIERIRARIQK